MWNEEEYLQRALNAAIELGDELIANSTVQDYEMVIVNDASTDATPQLADAAAAANSRIKVVHHPVNRKLGGSIKSGFAAATGDVVLYQMPICHLTSARYIKHCDSCTSTKQTLLLPIGLIAQTKALFEWCIRSCTTCWCVRCLVVDSAM